MHLEGRKWCQICMYTSKEIHSPLLLSIYAKVISLRSGKVAVSEQFTCTHISGNFYFMSGISD